MSFGGSSTLVRYASSMSEMGHSRWFRDGHHRSAHTPTPVDLLALPSVPRAPVAWVPGCWRQVGLYSDSGRLARLGGVQNTARPDDPGVSQAEGDTALTRSR